MRPTLFARVGALVVAALVSLPVVPALAAEPSPTTPPASDPAAETLTALPVFHARATASATVRRSAKARMRARSAAAVAPRARVVARARASAWGTATGTGRATVAAAAQTVAGARAAAQQSANRLARSNATRNALRKAERIAELRAFRKARAIAHDRALERSRATFGRQVIRTARAEAGSPYVYGAVGPSTFDCSGLVLFVMRKQKQHLPRTADQQFHATRRVSRSAAVPGDLVFFHRGSRTSHVYHVGIYAGRGMIWHSPHSGSHVRLEPIFSSAVTFGRV